MLHFRSTEGRRHRVTKVLPLLTGYDTKHSIVRLRDFHKALIIQLNQNSHAIEHHEFYAIVQFFKILNAFNHFE